MKRIATVACLYFSSLAAAEPLPNWAEPNEARVDSFASNMEEWGVGRVASEPPSGVRLPAEYEPTESIVMSWKGYEDVLEKISVEVAKAGADVLMIGGPESIDGVPQNQYFSVSLPSNSVWARDYGPTGVFVDGEAEPTIIDARYRHFRSRTNDDSVPCSIANREGMSCYTTDLILDGGNLMSDGAGNLFMTTRTYDWNSEMSRDQVDELLKSFFGVTKIHVLEYAKEPGSQEPSDGTGHIDMFAKILDKCLVLVAQAWEEPFRQPLEDAANYFKSLECEPGRKYTVYRIHGWTSKDDDKKTWYTFTNSLIVNDVVIIPAYSKAANKMAENIYRYAMPGYRVVGVNTDDSIKAGGSVHCLAQHIPRALES